MVDETQVSVPAVKEIIAQSTREELLVSLSEALQALRILHENRSRLEVLLKSKIESIKKPLIVLQGSFQKEDIEGCVSIVRNLGCDAVVVALPPHNSLVAMDDNDLASLGLMRCGLGGA
jgi:hypothetical protein